MRQRFRTLRICNFRFSIGDSIVPVRRENRLITFVPSDFLASLRPKGGSLKRSLGMAYTLPTIPKAFGFEAATQS